MLCETPTPDIRIPVPEEQRLALRGHFLHESLRGSLSLHGAELQVLRATDQSSLIEPGLKLIVMLQGQMEIAGQGFEQRLAGEKPQCVLLSLREPVRLRRRIPRSGPLQQLVLDIGPRWFSEGGLDQLPGFSQIETFCQRHAALTLLPDGRRATALGRSLMAHCQATRPFQRLQREALALQLILEALPALGCAQAMEAGPQAGKIEALTELLHAGAVDDWTVARMARHLASNTTTLQRAFRERHAQSIGQYLRGLKLERAHAALLCGSRVIDAAALAGYDNPANFATAFRRRYGLSPRELKPRPLSAHSPGCRTRCPPPAP
ncbi:MAG: helix-turn-helix transcriptional regulator [Roseateles asaccharophilus]|uniref:AraC family transcriptional regulator n=1 Tax=Roseateles asaccharophilus TaxID=582607 RepID=A0A4R6MTC9_9BURK|nr:helix-turn-helix transcriptional regulator [Roseateles asaccharophilus]TDP04551.1 AraC family transcriptional regulator [Roseateles asaccharophilus]